MEKSKKRKVLKCLCVFAGVVIAVLVIAILFLHLWPAFGARASREKMEGYAQRASNFHDGIFYNEEDCSVMRAVEEGVKNEPLSRKGTVPEGEMRYYSQSF